MINEIILWSKVIILISYSAFIIATLLELWRNIIACDNPLQTKLLWFYLNAAILVGIASWIAWMEV